MDLGTVFDCAVDRYPHKIAMVQDNKVLTFLQLNDEVNRLASSLQKLGIVKRDRVMVLLKNRIETVCLFWAAQKLGAIFTPINLRLSPEATQYCINDAEPKIVVYEKISQRAVMNAKFNERPLLISLEPDEGDLSYGELVAKGSNAFSGSPCGDDDIAVMLYTSGTTGVPKGVPRFHRNEYASTMAHIVQNRYELFDSTLGAMPLYHTMGVRSLLSMCVLNGKFVLFPDFDARKALMLLSEEQITCLYMFPTMYLELLNDPCFADFDLSVLKKIGYAGAPMSAALTQKCFHMLKPNHFINHYGSTEIYTFTTCSILDKKPGCAGRPGIHQKIRLVRPDAGSAAALENIIEPGEIGEILIYAESIEAFKGYWNRPEATRKAIRNHWYHTGDLGYYDEDGDLYVVGRVDEMVISGGENISPGEIEEVLLQHPKVAEAVVLGEEDEHWGQIVAAFIVAKDASVTVQELDQFCKQHPKLSNFKRPRKYVFIPEIPNSPSGKMLRREIRKELLSKIEM
ncbi:class I adenylate-forming enzyme family protein [Paenibacillus xerothermodurans]|uniref:Long-chain fatty acid--CoA ligase n=1 Tax=Paenibacillus xerothermodurans TaxID=1977292 RepID=A0A2W1NCH5_PAEXE|nr:class I adenylate-forming enzyme family protein [Paenibacillus xerothermodurans]PZE20761.1 long-chain fatty acid--CoA ligase [Paenibacillus xerothermodurans]